MGKSSNPLKKVFSTSPVTYHTVVNFKTPAAYQNFQAAIKNIANGAAGAAIEDIKSIDLYASTAEGLRQPLDHYEDISQAQISPVQIPAMQTIAVQTSYGKKELDLYRRHDENGSYIESDPSLGMKLTFRPAEKPSNCRIRYDVIPKNSPDVATLCEQIDLIYCFAKGLFRTDVKSTLKDKFLKSILSSYLYWTYVHELETYYKVKFDLCKVSPGDVTDVYLLYFLAIRKVPVRSYTDNFSFIVPAGGFVDTIPSSDQTMGFSGRLLLSASICGQTIEVSIARYIPAACVRVEQMTEGDASYRVQCVSSDAKPITVIDKLFDAAEDETPDFNQMLAKLKNAKTLDQLRQGF